MTDLGEILTDAEEALASLDERVRDHEGESVGSEGSGSIVAAATDVLETDRSDADEIRSDLEAVTTALDEAENVLSSIDFPALLEGVDAGEILDAIDAGEIPAALAGDEDADVVALRNVLKAVELTELLRAVDVTDLLESTRAVDEATDELTGGGEERADDGDGGDGGPIEAAASALGGDDGDLLETDAGDVAEIAEEQVKGEVDLLAAGDLSGYQSLIQQQAIGGVDAFRDALLETHGTFERVVEANRERTRSLDRRTNSRNPTAVSTIPGAREDLGSTPNHATMPRTVRHSDAPTRSHIYGDRFRRERERRGYE